MTSESLACPDCTTLYTLGDNYCRKCGMFLAALRELPVVTAPSDPPAIVPRERASLPAPVRKAATALAIGTALQIGLGLGRRYIAAQSARQLLNVAGPRSQRRLETAPVAQDSSASPVDGPSEVSETFMIRRVWIRRG